MKIKFNRDDIDDSYGTQGDNIHVVLPTLVIELDGGRTITIKQVGPTDISIEGGGHQMVVYPVSYNNVHLRTLGGLDSR